MQNNLETHGGNIYKASKIYGIKKEDILDYSANINPFGIPVELKDTLISEIDNLINYPDPECTSLKEAISDYLDVGKEHIIVGNGASEIISLFFDVLKPQKVLMPAPSFLEYAKAAESCGVRVEYHKLCEEKGFVPDLAELAEKAVSIGADTIFICNPNNPTSVLLDRDDLIELLEQTRERNINLVVDEAFIELTAQMNKNSLVGALGLYPNLFIIRAFTKVFAVPGLRLGYGLGNTEAIRKMWNKKQPWSVNSLACSFADYLPLCGSYLSRTSEWLGTEIERFYQELCQIPGIKLYKPHTNFILARITTLKGNVKELKHKMALNGILIRDASNFVFLDDSYFRIAVRDRASNEKVSAILGKCL